jgi:DNA polymerase III epsilon subunit-like protein
MAKLFFDTETTGKAFMKAPASDTRQPRLVQLAALLVEGTEEVACLSTIIKPDGFEIPKEASEIHGISTEYAKGHGVFITTALQMFSDFAQAADCLVAHNIDFDFLVLSSEYFRQGLEFPLKGSLFCTMKAATPICRLPGPYGFKWPKLSEAYKIATGQDHIGAHDALTDIRATVVVYNWLQSLSRSECGAEARAVSLQAN